MSYGLTYNDEERDARQAARGAKHLEANERRRARVLAFVAEHQHGTAPISGLAPSYVLHQLHKRGLVEVRYVITSDGRRKLAAEQT